MEEVDARLLRMLMGVVEAQKCAITALIATHPRPDWLRDAWQQSKPEWIDESDSMNVLKSPDYQRGFVQALGALSRSIDQAEAESRPDGPALPPLP